MDELVHDRVTIFLEKGSGKRPWRLSARTLSGGGIHDCYYGASDRALTSAEVDLAVANLSQYVREFLYVHGVQYYLPSTIPQ